MLLSRSRAVVAAVAALALVSAGCARPGAPGTSVKGFQASLAFGVKPPAQASPASNVAAAITASQALSDLVLPPPTLNSPPIFGGANPRGPALAVRTPCPAASSTAVAAEPAGNTVSNARSADGGVYRWKKAGSTTVATPAGVLTLPVAGFEQRAIRNPTTPIISTTNPATGDTTATYTYQTVQPALDGSGVHVTTWQVKNNALQRQVTAPNANAPAVSQGDPERGIVIKRIEDFDNQGRPIGAGFIPVTGLLMLPLPINTNENFTSVAVDPDTQLTAQVQATVSGPVQVDACGELLEGWKATGTLTLSSGDTRTFEDTFSLPLGGILIRDKFKQTAAPPAPSLDLDYTIGQITPTPVAP